MRTARSLTVSHSIQEVGVYPGAPPDEDPPGCRPPSLDTDPPLPGCRPLLMQISPPPDTDPTCEQNDWQTGVKT